MPRPSVGFIQDIISAAIDVIFSPLEAIFAPLIDPLVDLISLPDIDFSFPVSTSRQTRYYGCANCSAYAFLSRAIMLQGQVIRYLSTTKNWREVMQTIYRSSVLVGCHLQNYKTIPVQDAVCRWHVATQYPTYTRLLITIPAAPRGETSVFD